MLLAAIGLAASTSVFAQDLVKVSTPYAFLKDGSRISGTLNELCDALAKDTLPGYVEEAHFHNFFRPKDGNTERKLVCWVLNRWNDGSTSQGPNSAYGPAICPEGGLYYDHPDYCYSLLE